MMLTAADLKAALDDLRPKVVDGQVQKIFQRLDGALVFRVWRPVVGTTWMLISADPRAPRVSEVEGKGEVPPAPPGLCQWMRSTLSGRRLVSLSQRPGERVIEVGFKGGRLVAELFGRQSNLYGLDEAGRLVTMARVGVHRPTLMTGQVYTSPEGPSTPASGAACRVVDPAAPEPARQVESWATARIATREAAEAERARAQLLQGARRRLERLQANLFADADRQGDSEALLRAGELLKGQLHLVERGASTARVQDWYAPEAPWVEIELDPRLDGPGNVQKLFARYKKSRVGADRITERLLAVESQLERIDELEASELPLEALEAALKEAGLWRPKATGGGARGPQARRMPFRTFTSRAGEPIWVGRGGVDNHETTFHHARGNDYWLHVRDAAGSHVIAPCPSRNRDPHPETLLDAAALAVHHSKIRGESPADVMLARRKHVRAVAGAGPGRVTVAESRNVTVHDGAERIERLYRGPTPS